MWPQDTHRLTKFFLRNRGVGLDVLIPDVKNCTLPPGLWTLPFVRAFSTLLYRERVVVRLLFVVLLAAGAFFLGQRAASPQPDPVNVLLQVRDLNQLATARHTLQRVVTLTEQKQPVGAESILLILQADVEAGVDLSRITSAEIIASPGRVEIRLPKPEIRMVAVNEKETRVWDRQKTWWTPWVPYSNDLETKARQAGLDAARQAAIDAGILQQAEKNAAASLRGLLQMSGIKEVVIIPSKAS